eukprot:653864-Karenia_brevis.AAC.1
MDRSKAKLTGTQLGLYNGMKSDWEKRQFLAAEFVKCGGKDLGGPLEATITFTGENRKFKEELEGETEMTAKMIFDQW